MIRKALQKLPGGYHKICTIDLVHSEKQMLLVNGLSILTALGAGLVMNCFVPFVTLFRPEKGPGFLLLQMLVLFAASICYIVLHELVHAALMKFWGAKKVTFGFKDIYAYAGSQDYYPRPAYISIALAPVVVFFVIFAALQAAVSKEWFWIAGLLQISNLAGAAGDFYVSAIALKGPKGVLVFDTGTEMEFYGPDPAKSRQKETEKKR